MIRLSALFVSFCLLLGTGCRGNQSSTDASQKTPASTDTTKAAPASTASDETDSATDPADDKTSSAENKAEETSAGSDEKGSSSTPALTEAQAKRLGPQLRRLVQGDEEGPRPTEAVGTRGDVPVYGVFIYSDDADALRDAGIPLSTVQGEIISARLTVDQIREAATVDAVDAMRAATKQQLHSEPGEYERQFPEENGGQ